MKNIKRCPHCGGEASIQPIETKYSPMCIVKCRVCGAQTRLFGNACDDDQEAAIDAWNGRIEDQDELKQLLLDFITMIGGHPDETF